jgi:hypothetical protein
MRFITLCIGLTIITPAVARDFSTRSGPEGACGASCSRGHPCLSIERPEFDSAGHCECIPEPDCGASLWQKEKALEKFNAK